MYPIYRPLPITSLPLLLLQMYRSRPSNFHKQRRIYRRIRICPIGKTFRAHLGSLPPKHKTTDSSRHLGRQCLPFPLRKALLNVPIGLWVLLPPQKITSNDHHPLFRMPPQMIHSIAAVDSPGPLMMVAVRVRSPISLIHSNSLYPKARAKPFFSMTPFNSPH
jgi:hypothetical protein